MTFPQVFRHKAIWISLDFRTSRASRITPHQKKRGKGVYNGLRMFPSSTSYGPLHPFLWKANHWDDQRSPPCIKINATHWNGKLVFTHVFKAWNEFFPGSSRSFCLNPLTLDLRKRCMPWTLSWTTWFGRTRQPTNKPSNQPTLSFFSSLPLSSFNIHNAMRQQRKSHSFLSSRGFFVDRPWVPLSFHSVLLFSITDLYDIWTFFLGYTSEWGSTYCTHGE